MSIELKFIPLTFLNSKEEIRKQIKNTVVFSYLYNTFEETTLDHYLESTQYGYTDSASSSGSHRLLRITDINNSKVEWNSVPFCNCNAEEKYLLKDNDILIARTGGTTGKSFIVKNAPSNAIFASYLIRLRIKKDKVNIDFINYFLNCYAFWSQIIEMKSGTAMPNVNAEKLKTLKLPKCDFQIQNNIVSFLENQGLQEKYSQLNGRVKEIDLIFTDCNHTMVELTHQLELVNQLRQAFGREAIQGKLVKQKKEDGSASDLLKKIKTEKAKSLKKVKDLAGIKEEEISFKIPNNWVWCRLGEVSEIKRGKGPEYSEKGVFKMLNQKCVRWFVVDTQFAKAVDEQWFKEISEDFIVHTNDVLVNSTGDGTIGRSAISDEKVEGFIFDSHILKITSSIDQSYICYFINSDFGQKLVETAKGATSTKQTELGVNNLNNFVFPLPPLAEQKRIVNKMEQLMQLCDELEKSIKQSKEQTQLLLQSALSEALREKESVEA